MPHLMIEWQTEDAGEQTTTIDGSRGTLIGRDLENDIVLRCPYVSRHHAVIYYFENSFYLQNLSETNPTLYNDRLELEAQGEVDIRPGDYFTLGQVRLHIPFPS